MSPEARYLVVFDHADKKASQLFLAGLHDSERGRVVVEVLVGDRSQLGLLHALLAGLGKELDLPGSDRAGKTSWTQALIWTEVLGIRELFVTRAHLLDGGGWQFLCELAAACRLRLWLVNQVAEPTRGQREALQRWPFERMEASEFESRWGDAAEAVAAGKAPASAPAPAGEARFPEVPEADFVLFRAQCRTSMSPADFEAVDREFAIGFAAADHSPETAEQVGELVIKLAQTATSVDQAIAHIRGLQAGLLWSGWLIRTDLIRCRAWLSERLDLRQAQALGPRLMACASPAWACLGALTLYLDLSPPQLARMTIAELRGHGYPEDGSVLSRCCRAQALARRYEGAEPADLAFASEADPEASSLMVRRRLGLLAEDLGLPLVRQRRATSSRAAKLLARDSGFTVSSLQRAERG